MARPKKAPDERRDARLAAPRVTRAEAAFVEEQAAAAGLDPAELIRRRVLGRRVAPARSVADDSLLLEINRIGVNLNQLAQRANQSGAIRSEEALQAVLMELRTVLAKVARAMPHGP